MTTVYLAGKMGDLSKEDMKSWRDSATEYLESHGFSVQDPTTVMFDHSIGIERPQEITENNKYMIDNSEIVLVEFDNPELDISIGTVCEVVYAYMQGMPILVWGRDQDTIEHPWIEYHSVRSFEKMEDVLDYLVNCY